MLNNNLLLNGILFILLVFLMALAYRAFFALGPDQVVGPQKTESSRMIGKFGRGAEMKKINEGQIEACKGDIRTLTALLDLTYKHLKMVDWSPVDVGQFLLNTKTDEEYFRRILEALEKIKGVELAVDEMGINAVDRAQANKHWREVKFTVKGFNPQKYLDIGCGSGSKTLAIGQKFNIRPENIHGTDIPNWGHFEEARNKYLNFKYIKDNKLDYEPASFDFISIFMVIHHVPEQDRAGILAEVKRVAKPGAVILVREHDCQSDGDRMLIDIEHSIYSRSYPDRVEKDFVNNYFADYLSIKTTIDLFESNNFNYVNSDYDYKDFHRRQLQPTRGAWFVFKAPEKAQHFKGRRGRPSGPGERNRRDKNNRFGNGDKDFGPNKFTLH